MAYILETKTDKAQMANPTLTRVEFQPEEVAKADRLEVWASSFSDPGDDWCEYRLMAGAQAVAIKRMAGF